MVPKYGDAIFLRDPETKKLFHVDPAKLTRIIVNESEGKRPEQYIIKEVNLNSKKWLLYSAPQGAMGTGASLSGASYQSAALEEW